MGGKKKKKQTKHQDRVKLKKRTKTVQGRVNRILEGVVSRIPEGVGSGILQSKVNDFTPGGAKSSQERWLLWSPGI